MRVIGIGILLCTLFALVYLGGSMPTLPLAFGFIMGLAFIVAGTPAEEWKRSFKKFNLKDEDPDFGKRPPSELPAPALEPDHDEPVAPPLPVRPREARPGTRGTLR